MCCGSQASLPADPCPANFQTPFFDAESAAYQQVTPAVKALGAPGGIKLRHQLTLSANQVRLCS
jgi:hypothetical protein